MVEMMNYPTPPDGFKPPPIDEPETTEVDTIWNVESDIRDYWNGPGTNRPHPAEPHFPDEPHRRPDDGYGRIEE